MYYYLCSIVPNLIVPDFFAMKVRIDLSHCSLAVIGLTLCYSPAISCRELQILSKAAQVSQNTYVYFKHTYSHSPVSKDLLYFCNSITNWTVIQSHISNLTQKNNNF